MYRFDANGQLTMLELEASEGTGAPPKRRPGRPDSELVSVPYFHLDLVSGSVDLFGQRHWELRSPWRKGKRPLNTGAAPRIPIRVPLSGILEANPAQKYYLSKVACIGILRRAFERGKELPKKLERALKIQAGLMRPDGQPTGLEAYHINQRDEGIDLHGVSGALLATTNMQMQTFVTQPDDAVEGFDGYNGDLTGDVAATLGVNCGMSTGRNGVMAFAANQRDEVRDLHDLAGALGAQPGMKQQTFVAGFSAGAGSSAGGIGYNESVAPTLKGSPGGNCMPSVLCLNDQGGSVMNCKELPKKLERPKNPSGAHAPDGQPTGLEAYHINQRDEGIDLHGVSGALLATTNMQMQTFVTQPDDAVEGFDGYNGDLTGDVAATLGVNCGMSTGRNGVMAFAANQRDEVRDLHDLAGALGAQPGMKQQTFVAGFSAGAGSSAGGIGYNESVAPTLKGSPGGNCMPSVLCLNDQGGSVMNCSENISGTLRAQEHGHQPLVYENHGIDSRYTGPHKVAPTMSARYGTGGNNVPLVEQEADAICIAGNTVDRQPQNGGNGLGCQDDLAYTLTATDRHAVYSRQRVDDFRHNDVASTQSPVSTRTQPT